MKNKKELTKERTLRAMEIKANFGSIVVIALEIYRQVVTTSTFGLVNIQFQLCGKFGVPYIFFVSVVEVTSIQKVYTITSRDQKNQGVIVEIFNKYIPRPLEKIPIDPSLYMPIGQHDTMRKLLENVI